MSRDSLPDGPYLDLQAQHFADRSFMGSLRLSTRLSCFFFMGALSLLAFTTLYMYVNDHLETSLYDWQRAEQLSTSVERLDQSINHLAIMDPFAQLDGSDEVTQQHRAAVERVLKTLEDVERLPQTRDLQNSIVTLRDAFSNYGSAFALMIESKAILEGDEHAGLIAQKDDIASRVESLLIDNAMSALIADFDILNGLNKQDRPNADEIKEAYEHLMTLMSRSLVNDDVKEALGNELLKHRDVVSDILATKIRLGDKPDSFHEIQTYLSPALEKIKTYSATLQQESHKTFEGQRNTMRKLLVGGSAGIVLILILTGLVLMFSMVNPMRRLSAVVIKIASGQRDQSVPLRGNLDSIGEMARALDRWLDLLAERDHLRAEIDDLRMRSAMGAIASAVTTATVMQEQIQPKPSSTADYTPDTPLTIATRELNQYSESVTETAKDVERTETLIQVLADTSRQMDDLALCVGGIRDQANDAGQPFDEIRKGIDQAGELSAKVRASLVDLSRVAQDIASHASQEAQQATNNLLTQSESLQSMLDALADEVNETED